VGCSRRHIVAKDINAGADTLTTSGAVETGCFGGWQEAGWLAALVSARWEGEKGACPTRQTIDDDDNTD